MRGERDHTLSEVLVVAPINKCKISIDSVASTMMVWDSHQTTHIFKHTQQPLAVPI